jgi:nucleotide-binding universal stress UspA family protein
MFRRLLVPLDGSSLAERALPYAVRLAESRGRLVLMRAEAEHEPSQAVTEAEEYLRDMAQHVSPEVPVETVVMHGHAAPQILAAAQQFDADAIVMASHGRTGLPHLLFGSVTEAVLANGILPVLVIHVRPGEAPASPFAPYSARVLVAQDGSIFDAAARQAALDVVGVHGEVVLMTAAPEPDHVIEDERGQVFEYLDQLEEGRRQAGRDYLNIVADELRRRPYAAEVTTDVRIGDPATCITLAATERGVDLVVMATHGRTGVRRAMDGSVAGTVLRTGPTPVLLVNPHVAEPSAEVASDKTATAV